MKKILILILLCPFTSLFAFDISFKNAKNDTHKIEYSWDIALIKPLQWYVDFWNTVSAKKEYHFINIIGENLKDLPAYISEKISHLSDEFIYIKNILWENKLKKLLKTSQISIYWEQNKCEDRELIHPSLKDQKISCLYENDKNLSSNTKNTVSYFVESPKKQKIKVKIFPVTNKEYLFYTYDDVERGQFPLITIIDNSLDYYNLFLKYSSWESKYLFDMSTSNFQKKYSLTQFDKNTYKLPNNIWIVREMLNTTYTLVPYYETEIEVQKWWNTIVLEYNTYTAHKENIKDNIIIQQ